MLEVILNGGFLTCSALLAASSVQIFLGRQRVRHRLQELDELRTSELRRQQRIVELSRINAAHQFEVRWLTCIADQTDLPSRLFAILDDVVGHAGDFHAWIMDAEGNVLGMNPAARRLCSSVAITHAGSQLLRKEAGSILSRAQREFVLIPEIPAERLRELHFFPCAPEPAESNYLCLSRIPNLTGDEIADRALLTGLCRQIKVSHSHAEVDELATSADELDLIRDMLTLRTLTDDDFESPRVMLQEFLTRLAQLTNFERASLYLPGAENSSQLELVATGGTPFPHHDAAGWTADEMRLMDSQRVWNQEAVWIEHRAAENNQPELPPSTCLIASDFVNGGPVTAIVLSSRIPVTRSRIKEELAKWSAQFLPQTFEKALIRMQNEDRARRDGLTRVANRHTFDSELQKSVKACLVNRLPCSLLLIDLDHFKSINDTYGHVTGDAVLQSVAATITQTVQQLRIADRALVARYGGEEFAVLLPEMSLAGANRIAEQVRLAIEQRGGQNDHNRLSTTASIGVASLPTHGSSSLTIVHAADEGLYAAKHAGRNCVRVAPRKELPQLPVYQTQFAQTVEN